MNDRPIALVPVLLCFLFGWAIWHQVPDRIKIDGLGGELVALLSSMDTEYADDYSHSGFNRIQVGMSEKEVLRVLGEPLVRCRPYMHTRSKHKAHIVSFEYSESPSSTNYRLRQVYMNQGIVEEKIGRIYLD